MDSSSGFGDAAGVVDDRRALAASTSSACSGLKPADWNPRALIRPFGFERSTSSCIQLNATSANVAKHCLAMSPKNPRIPPPPAQLTEVLVFPQVQLLDVAGPIQVFTAANELAAKSER
jgi:hypothetical protein